MSPTARDLLDAIHARYAGDGWAVLEEVQARTGVEQRRIDALALSAYPSLGFRRVALEVKVSRGDFTRDVRKFREKHGDALAVSTEFFYVAPAGMIRKDELPAEAGLLEYGSADKLRVKVRAPVRASDPEALGVMLAVMARRAQAAEAYASTGRFGVLYEALGQIASLANRGAILKPRGHLRTLWQSVTEPDGQGLPGLPGLGRTYRLERVAQFALCALRLHYPVGDPPALLPVIGAGENVTCPAGHVLATALQPVYAVDLGESHRRDLRLEFYEYRVLKGDLPYPHIDCSCGLRATRYDPADPAGAAIHVEGGWRPMGHVTHPPEGAPEEVRA